MLGDFVLSFLGPCLCYFGAAVSVAAVVVEHKLPGELAERAVGSGIRDSLLVDRLVLEEYESLA